MNSQDPTIPEGGLTPATLDDPAAEAPAVKTRRPRARKVAEVPAGLASAPEGGEREGVTLDAQVAVPTPAEGEPVEQEAAARPRRRKKPEAEIQAPVVEQAEVIPVEAAAVVQVDGPEDDSADEAEVISAPRPQPAEVGEVFAQVLSGEFDVDSPEIPPIPAKRVLLPDPDAPKLHKVLAQAGVGSRRDMEQMIVDGLITVNGHSAHIGQRISFGDQIKVDGKPIRVSIVPPPPRIIAYHKPAGEVVTHDDPQHRPTVFRRLPRLPKGKWQSVGRLDLNTEGLLLFTNSGELANQLMHPRFGVEREYAVRVLGTLEPEAKAKLLEGVEIEGQQASFKSVETGGGEGVNRWYRVVITEGRNREVRKLFDSVGLTVSRLIRIRYGTVVLPHGLKRGAWVDLHTDDVQIIRQLAGAGTPRSGRDGRDSRDARDTRGGGRDGGRDVVRDGGRNHRNKQRGNDVQRRNQPPQERFAERGQQQVRQNPVVQRTDEFEDDFDPRQIPNPLEQTFDKRFVSNPRSPAGGRGFRNGGGGFGSGGSGPAPSAAPKKGAPREPDPLQTSVGYIGADAFHRKGGGGGRSGGGSRGGGGGYGGGGGGGGGRRGR